MDDSDVLINCGNFILNSLVSLNKTEKIPEETMSSETNIWSGKVEGLVHMIFLHVNVNTPICSEKRT